MTTRHRTGRMDQRVTLEQRTLTRDTATGAQLEAWAAVATVWAEVVESSTAAGLSAGAGEALAAAARPSLVRIRWRSGITREAWRVRLSGNRLLRIAGVAEKDRQARLELSCMEWAHE